MTKELDLILLKIIGEENNPDLHSKIISEIGYEVFKKHFKEKREDYDKFSLKIHKNEKNRQFEKIIRFYYFWCKRPKVDSLLFPDFKLLVMFSIMEDLVTQNKYLTFSDWLKEKVSRNTILLKNTKEIEKIVTEYHATNGSKKKICSFLENYFPKKEMHELLGSVKYFNKKKGDFEPLSNISDFFSFVDGARNLFIHKATHIQIGSKKEWEEYSKNCNHFSSRLLTQKINDKSYVIDNTTIHIEALLDGFEKSLIKYFSEDKCKK